MRKRSSSALSAPFLRRIRPQWAEGNRPEEYPFDLQIFNGESWEIEFSRPISIFVGPNGSGKSTLLEAIAANCGFPLEGGSKSHGAGSMLGEELSRELVFSWLPKISDGFFLGAESISSFIGTIDRLAAESGEELLDYYGGQSLSTVSHGQATERILNSRLQRRGVYVLDEPEAALSPSREVELLKLFLRIAGTGDCQIILATHSPLIMACPGAEIFEIESGGLRKTTFERTEHFREMKQFYLNPAAYIQSRLI